MDSISALGVIYLILNTKNGKVYIGQATNVQRRWKRHVHELNKGCHGNRYLQASWNKYGEKAFKFQKLEYCPIDQLDEREQHFLNIYMPRGLCYNIVKDVKAANRGRTLSEETRRKISEANKGRVHTDEERRKQSEAQKGRKLKPHTEETKRKISESEKGRSPVVMTQEIKQKISSTMKGHIVTEETRRKQSEAGKRYYARRKAEKEESE